MCPETAPQQTVALTLPARRMGGGEIRTLLRQVTADAASYTKTSSTCSFADPAVLSASTEPARGYPCDQHVARQGWPGIRSSTRVSALSLVPQPGRARSPLERPRAPEPPRSTAG